MKKFFNIIIVLLFGAVLGNIITPALSDAFNFEISTFAVVASIDVSMLLLVYNLPAGILAMNFADLPHVTGEDNMAGVFQEWYWAFVDDVATCPPLPLLNSATDDYARSSNISDPIIMKTGKKFYKGYSTINTAKIDYKMVGPDDSKSFENSLSFEHPNIGSVLSGFLRGIKNRDLIIIGKDKNGNLRLIGSLDNPARLAESDGSTGAKAEDGNKSSLKFVANEVCPAPIYDADVPLTPAA